MKAKCAVDGCEAEARDRDGVCDYHFAAIMKHDRESVELPVTRVERLPEDRTRLSVRSGAADLVETFKRQQRAISGGWRPPRGRR